MTDNRAARGWEMCAVGCHWWRGRYVISTISSLSGASGYVVAKDAKEIAQFISWDEAEKLADRRKADRRKA